MTTHIPRKPYTPEELEKLYPKDLELQLVQILLRHGMELERNIKHRRQ
jgi:acid phosphatase